MGGVPILRDELGRFYTSEIVSDYLVSNLAHTVPDKVLDLGAGAGSLSLAARRRWERSQLVTVDVDKHSRKALISGLQGTRHRHFQLDALSKELTQTLSHKVGKFDIAISNPPYVRPRWKVEYGEILEEVGFSSGLATITDATADILFLAQMLRVLSNKGKLGIIVPDGLVTNKIYTELRRIITTKFRLENVIKLPRHAFEKTEAQAYIMIISKSFKAPHNIRLEEMLADGTFKEPIFIQRCQASLRLDYSFHAFETKNKNSRKYRTLDNVGATISRGVLNSKQTRESANKVFHTTDFPTRKVNLKFSHVCHSKGPGDDGLARKGDILLARVGRNFYKKVGIVMTGATGFSDCVFRIRAPKKFQKAILVALQSKSGQEWLASRSKGVGAKLLSKFQLQEFPFERFSK